MHKHAPHLPGRKILLEDIRWNVLIMLIITGCATPHIAPRHKRPPLDPQHILEQIHSRNPKIRNLSGFSKFSLQNRDKKQSGTIAINVKKDALLRFEILNLFSQPIQYFMANKQRLIIYNPGKNSAITGTPDARNVNRLIGVRIEMSDLVSFLLGAPPDLDRFQHTSIMYEADTDRYHLQTTEQNTITELWIDPDTFCPVQYRCSDQEGNVRLLVKWDELRRIEEITFATKIFIELPQEKTVIEVKYTDFDINQDIAPDIFSLKMPTDTSIVQLEP